MKGADEARMIAGNDEVGTEYGNDAFYRNVCGVSAHGLGTMLLTIGCDGLAVFEEVAEGPVNGGHNRLKGPETLVFCVN